RHFLDLPQGGGLRYTERNIAPSAQTKRPEDAGPVRASLGGKNRTGRFCSNRTRAVSLLPAFSWASRSPSPLPAAGSSTQAFAQGAPEMPCLFGASHARSARRPSAILGVRFHRFPHGDEPARAQTRSHT